MHYANGQEAKAGDLVICVQQKGSTHEQQAIGVLVSAQATCESCNGSLSVFAVRFTSSLGLGPWVPFSNGQYPWTVTLSECNPIDPAVIFAPPQPPSNS